MNIEQGIPKDKAKVGSLRTSAFHVRRSLSGIRYSLLIVTCLATITHGGPVAAGTDQQAGASLANAFASFLESVIPHEYEKRKDWGKTKNITVGIRMDGIKVHRRKKAVKHGVWKHYKIQLVDPDETLDIRIENLHSVEGGRFGFTVTLRAKFDIWARAKVYEYGVHLISMQVLGDASIDLAIDCEIGMRFQTQEGSACVALDPLVTDARLDVSDFHLRKVSRAKGPIIRELGEELPRIIERELQGPKLVAKLNRAINKKRDRLELSF